MSIGRGSNPNTFGMLVHPGKLNFSQFRKMFHLFREKFVWQNRLFNIDSNQSPTYNMLEMNIGLFYGFGEHRFRHCI